VTAGDGKALFLAGMICQISTRNASPSTGGNAFSSKALMRERAPMRYPWLARRSLRRGLSWALVIGTLAAAWATLSNTALMGGSFTLL
jgi:hypothetical protein